MVLQSILWMCYIADTVAICICFRLHLDVSGKVNFISNVLTDLLHAGLSREVRGMSFTFISTRFS